MYSHTVVYGRGNKMYHCVDIDTEGVKYHELPDPFKKSVEMTLNAVGITRYGNAVIEEYRKEGTEIVVKVQRGTGQEIDLTNVRKVHGDILHLATILHEGKVEKIHNKGYMTISVRARY